MWSCCSITRRRYFSHIRYCFNKERKKVRNSRTFFIFLYRLQAQIQVAPPCLSTAQTLSFSSLSALSFSSSCRIVSVPQRIIRSPYVVVKKVRKSPASVQAIFSYLSVQSLFYTFCKLTLTHFHNGIFSILLCSACYNISFILPLRLHGINADINC